MPTINLEQLPNYQAVMSWYVQMEVQTPFQVTLSIFHDSYVL